MLSIHLTKAEIDSGKNSENVKLIKHCILVKLPDTNMGFLISMKLEISFPDRDDLSWKEFNHRRDHSLSSKEGFKSNRKTYRPWLKHMCIHETKQIVEIHFPGLWSSIRQLKMFRSTKNWLFWIVLQTSGENEVDTFWGFVNVFSPILNHEYNDFGTRPMVECMYVVRKGNFRASDRTELLFGLKQNFLFLINKSLYSQSCFSLSFYTQFFLAFATRFSKISFGKITLWNTIEVWLLLVPLRAEFFAEISARWFALCFQRAKFRILGNLIVAKAAGKLAAF